jgi:hypothetical protein
VQADAKTPTVQAWNFAVEQQIDPNTALRLAYVGSFGYHGLLSVDLNSIPAQICSSAAGCQTGGVGAARDTVPQGAQFIPVGTRPNPYLSGGFFWNTEGNSRYNSLQIDVTRRLSQGLQFRANYTWSKNLDSTSEGIRIRIEFQKPTEMPLHSNPVQAEDQAWAHGANVTSSGNAKILPCRISVIGLIEVMPITYRGSRKNSAALIRKK